MSVINTNYLALVSQNNLTKSQNSLGTAIERLSSGLRINSAKDDAAGQAIANRFTANINGLTQAARNANDGISIAQTTEGSLNEINENLQRIRTLSVQAATGSNSDTDLQSIQNEINERLEEINRISKETQFNGVKVLGDDASALTVQVGAHDNERIQINLSRIDVNSLKLGNYDISNKSVNTADLGAALTTAKPGVDATITRVQLSATDSSATATAGKIYVKNDDPDTLVMVKDGKAYDFDSYDAASGTIKFSTTENTTATAALAAGYTEAADDAQVAVGGGVTVTAGEVNLEGGAAAAVKTYFMDSNSELYVVLDGDKTKAIKADDFNESTGEITYDGNGTPVDLTATGNEHTAVLTNHDYITGSTDAVAVDMGGLSASLVGDNPTLHKVDGQYIVKGTANGADVFYEAELGADGKVTLKTDSKGENIQRNADPLASIDAAVQQVDDLRSHLGAIQNRFQSTIANLNNTVNNLSAARSRIEDADYAVEVSNMTRAQILQQAGTSVLAQANQVPQTVLSLLR
ncbi:flagellin [Paenalcaligenes suwonensis]|uniref:flagellin N-terminal helical domain-containing protein n=1 Tax=Paenalcaligenes suwonensis TaxID=1202713 RepID=UPI001409D5B2|nr:flagellin [Paenalcaligenes suwonensis]NHC61045.1 flagellin FliC [Paenalcaligenes suwonensis]